MSLEDSYHADLQMLMDEAQKLQKLLPSCHIGFTLNNWTRYVYVNDATHADLLKLQKSLRQTFWKKNACGFITAYNNREVFAPDQKRNGIGKDAKLPIVVNTNIKCGKCSRQNSPTSIRALMPLLLTTNVRASIWRIFRFLLENFWVGRGYNPDYTQACTIGGSCSCQAAGFPCDVSADCVNIALCTCTCPAPSDPNSSKVSDCTKVPLAGGFTCSCRALTKKCLAGGACNCAGCAGTCGYNCNVGFVWNGVKCVALAGKNWLMDGYKFLEW